MSQSEFDADQGELKKNFHAFPVSHNSRYNIDVTGDNLATKCAKCEYIVPFEACENCSGKVWVGGADKDGVVGLFCEHCDLGQTRWTCRKCGASNSIRASFGQIRGAWKLNPLIKIILALFVLSVIVAIFSSGH